MRCRVGGRAQTLGRVLLQEVTMRNQGLCTNGMRLLPAVVVQASLSFPGRNVKRFIWGIPERGEIMVELSIDV